MLWSELVVLGLFIRSDNSFEVHVDGEKKANGSLLKDMQPPVNPPKETRLHDSMNVCFVSSVRQK